MKFRIALLFAVLCFPFAAIAGDEGLLVGAPKIEPPGLMVRIKAMMGNSEAQSEMGMAYATGAGVDRSMIDARQWWEKAAASGNNHAQYALGLLFAGTGYDGVTQDFGTASSWFNKAADAGYVWAQFSLGYFYDAGIGTEQNNKLAGQWYLRAADAGNEYAQHNVGMMFETGQGTPVSYVDAVKWYRKSAQQGNAKSAYFLGKMFEDGRGVQADIDLAATYYRRAADGGVAAAQTRMGDFYYDGKGGLPQKYEEALQWYRKAAERNDVTAAILLARMYDAGVGTNKDPVEASKWSRASMKAANAKPPEYKMGLESFNHFLVRKKIEDDSERVKKEETEAQKKLEKKE